LAPAAVEGADRQVVVVDPFDAHSVAPEVGGVAASGVAGAVGTLDFDHRGAHPRQQQGGVGTGQSTGYVEDDESVEGPGLVERHTLAHAATSRTGVDRVPHSGQRVITTSPSSSMTEVRARISSRQTWSMSRAS